MNSYQGRLCRQSYLKSQQSAIRHRSHFSQSHYASRLRKGNAQLFYGAASLALVVGGGGISIRQYSSGSGRSWPKRQKLDSGDTENVSFWQRATPFISHPKPTRDQESTRSTDDASTQKFTGERSEEKPGQQPPPPQTRVDSDDKVSYTGAESPDSVWQGVSSKVGAVSSKVNSLGDTIVDYIIPDWVKVLPGFLNKLQSEMDMAPGSLAKEIWEEAHDPEINPEIIWEAGVRISNDLCDEEKNFLQHRKAYTKRALAKYLGIPENDIHPEDVPTIAICGSGGGLRALVAGSSSYLKAKEDGLFDCVTYTAGVSGSCWLQALYYSSITSQNHERLINHLKHRLNVHIAFPPAALELLVSAPTNKYLLSGLLEKMRGVPDADFGIVDIYGLLLAARLMVPRGELGVDYRNLKISNQRKYIDDGSHPLPIYTAVRHEIPPEDKPEMTTKAGQAQSQKEAWFQWFEFTPYEFWCEELEAGIPVWSIGRQFKNGRTVWRDNGLGLPELRIPLLMGIWGSAFCATLSHYYKEVRPIMQGLAGFSGIDQMVAERDDDLIKVHPIDPANIPNYVMGMQPSLPPSVPDSIFSEPHLQLMDAGMSNNLPIYPLLRPGRDVDILIAFDASADVKTDNWLKVADGYVRQRGIEGWPVGIGWPTEDSTPKKAAADLEAAQADTEREAAEKIEEAKDDQEQERKAMLKGKNGDLGYCNIWVGKTEERTSEEEPPWPKQVEDDWEIMQDDAGIVVIYFPFLANPKVEGVDPKKSDFMSTWNFVYTPEQIDKVVALARANADEGKEQTKRAVRAVYERKKAKRLEREREGKAWRRSWKLRMGLAGRKHSQGDHGDHFS